MRYDPDRDKELRALRQRIEELEAENEALKSAKAIAVDPVAVLAAHYKLRPRQAMVLHELRHGRPVSHDALLDACTDGAMLKILAVYICNLRKILKERGSAIKIETVWGRAYHITSGLDELRQVINGAPSQAARLDYVDSEMLR